MALRAADVNRYFPVMAVATGREHGLFINGETAGAASGETRELFEPATGETAQTR